MPVTSTAETLVSRAGLRGVHPWVIDADRCDPIMGAAFPTPSERNS
jgi:hypothetical protein